MYLLFTLIQDRLGYTRYRVTRRFRVSRRVRHKEKTNTPLYLFSIKFKGKRKRAYVLASRFQ